MYVYKVEKHRASVGLAVSVEGYIPERRECNPFYATSWA